jgi:hypothetical protein
MTKIDYNVHVGSNGARKLLFLALYLYRTETNVDNRTRKIFTPSSLVEQNYLV